jgi:hypothetical protein
MTLTLTSRPRQRHGKMGAKSVTRECEGMNPHTPKWTRTLGVIIPMEFQIFKKIFKTHLIKKFIIPLEAFEI